MTLVSPQEAFRSPSKCRLLSLSAFFLLVLPLSEVESTAWINEKKKGWITTEPTYVLPPYPQTHHWEENKQFHPTDHFFCNMKEATNLSHASFYFFSWPYEPSHELFSGSQRSPSRSFTSSFGLSNKQRFIGYLAHPEEKACACSVLRCHCFSLPQGVAVENRSSKICQTILAFLCWHLTDPHHSSQNP